LKVYNILVTLLVLFGCEIWTLKQRNIRNLNAAEMKFMLPTAESISLSYRRSEDILEEI
jgi:hypothetical protein